MYILSTWARKTHKSWKFYYWKSDMNESFKANLIISCHNRESLGLTPLQFITSPWYFFNFSKSRFHFLCQNIEISWSGFHDNYNRLETKDPNLVESWMKKPRIVPFNIVRKISLFLFFFFSLWYLLSRCIPWKLNKHSQFFSHCNLIKKTRDQN